MDTELLRTFLEINRTKHFGRAANNLYLTQSAVSSRMRLLEQAIGMSLLTRSRNDIQLTPAGRKLLPHAEAIVERWVQAQHEVVLHEDERAAINIATVLPVSDLLMSQWVKQMWDSFPDLGLTVDIVSDEVLVDRLLNRSVDVAITYDPPSDAGLKVERLQPLTLHLLSTTPGQSIDEAMNANYIFIEWGSWFGAAHAKIFPHSIPGGLRIRSPKLVFELLRKRDGACYMPVNLGSEQAEKLELFPVTDAQPIEHAAYAVYATDLPNCNIVRDVLALLLDAEGQADSSS